MSTPPQLLDQIAPVNSNLGVGLALAGSVLLPRAVIRDVLASELGRLRAEAARLVVAVRDPGATAEELERYCVSIEEQLGLEPGVLQAVRSRDVRSNLSDRPQKNDEALHQPSTECRVGVDPGAKIAQFPAHVPGDRS